MRAEEEDEDYRAEDEDYRAEDKDYKAEDEDEDYRPRKKFRHYNVSSYKF